MTDQPSPAELAGREIARGRWHLDDNWLNQAEIHYRRALEHVPGHREALRYLGIVLIKLGRPAEGLTLLRDVATRSPEHAPTWCDFAVALRDHGLREAAEAAYAHLRTLQPSAPPLATAPYVYLQAAHAFKQVDYDYTAKARYGAGRPPHPGLDALIGAGRDRYEAVLRAMAEDFERFAAIPWTGDYAAAEPFWLNSWFPPLDGMAVYTLLRTTRPKRFMEIGSGVSTKFARHSVTVNGLPTRITSIDPQPRNLIDRLCDEVRRLPLEACPVEMFDELEPGDILFLDSSHRALQNSDVTAFFLDILPRVKPGVLVHVHDIYLPEDYLPGHQKRLWNEQYLLATALLYGGSAFEVAFPCWYVSQDQALSQLRDGLLRQGPLSGLSLHGCSFWLRKT